MRIDTIDKLESPKFFLETLAIGRDHYSSRAHLHPSTGGGFFDSMTMTICNVLKNCYFSGDLAEEIRTNLTGNVVQKEPSSTLVLVSWWGFPIS